MDHCPEHRSQCWPPVQEALPCTVDPPRVRPISFDVFSLVSHKMTMIIGVVVEQEMKSYGATDYWTVSVVLKWLVAVALWMMVSCDSTRKIFYVYHCHCCSKELMLLR